jgi:hypothetical protein
MYVGMVNEQREGAVGAREDAEHDEVGLCARIDEAGLLSAA